jgi:membrane protease YdiL (CAAX protease family)
MLAMFLVILRWPIGPFGKILKFLEEFIQPLFKDCTILDLAVISLLAGFGEEMLFRAGLQAWLERGLGPWWALGIASLAFGLMHPISLTYVALAALLGAYLGGVWMLTGNLIVVAVAHGLYDFLILLYLLRQ